jgi:glyoxylase-like metal-dependent hydrolase (beta-lactamase superfamily II)
VHTYRSGETGLFVNSYLVEGADGVVAIDSPLLRSDGHAFRARLEALKKPLLGVLVTHPHPDHSSRRSPSAQAHADGAPGPLGRPRSNAAAERSRTPSCL